MRMTLGDPDNETIDSLTVVYPGLCLNLVWQHMACFLTTMELAQPVDCK